MAYKCLNCERIVEEPRIKNYILGEYEGQNVYDTYCECPHCHCGELEETKPCLICGEEHTEEELFGGICEECIKNASQNLEICLSINQDMKEKVEINAVLASLFTPTQIEEILLKQLPNDTDCSQFANEDLTWFGERLAEINKEIR